MSFLFYPSLFFFLHPTFLISLDYSASQISITYGNTIGTTIKISWVTIDNPGTYNNNNNIESFSNTDPNVIWYDTKENGLSKVGLPYIRPYKYHYVSLYEEYTSNYLNTVLLYNLIPNTKYYYSIGNSKIQTSILSFKTPPVISPSAVYSIGIIGDLGQTSDSLNTINNLIKEDIGIVMLVGDLSYADSGWISPGPYGPCTQKLWDSWGKIMEPLISKIPILTLPGNHEVEAAPNMESYLSYKSRYIMPYKDADSDSPLYYSYKVASAHIIMINSYLDCSPTSSQYKFIAADLAKVDRSITPWLIVSMHAPWYNSNQAHQNESSEYLTRQYLEPLFISNNVDIIFAGHVHSYERSHNVALNVTKDGAPVYINIGDGGNREGLASNWLTQPTWSAYRKASFGYGKLTFMSATTAKWTWYINNDKVQPDGVDELHFIRNVDSFGVKAAFTKKEI